MIALSLVHNLLDCRDSSLPLNLAKNCLHLLRVICCLFVVELVIGGHLGFCSELAQLDEVIHARVPQLEGPLDELELLFIALALLTQPGLNDLVRLTHLDRFVVLDHDFVEAIAKALDLTRDRVIIILI